MVRAEGPSNFSCKTASISQETTGSTSDCVVDITRYTLSDLEDSDLDSD